MTALKGRGRVEVAGEAAAFLATMLPRCLESAWRCSHRKPRTEHALGAPESTFEREGPEHRPSRLRAILGQEARQWPEPDEHLVRVWPVQGQGQASGRPRSRARPRGPRASRILCPPPRDRANGSHVYFPRGPDEKSSVKIGNC